LNALIFIRYLFVLQGELSTRLATLARGKPQCECIDAVKIV